jgi:hypothetical protein
LSWQEVASIVSTATGHQTRVPQISDGAMRDGLAGAVGEIAIEAMMGMSTGLRDGYTLDPRRDVSTTTPTTLEAWAYAILRPLMAREL